MKIMKAVGWILGVSGLLALEAGAQSNGASVSVKQNLARPPFAAQPSGGNLGDDLVFTGASVNFALPLGKPRFGGTPGGTAALQVASRDIRSLHRAATGIRIDLSSLSALVGRLAERQLHSAGDTMAIRVATASQLFEIEVRKRAHDYDFSVKSVTPLGKPLGGLTPGGKAAAKPRVKRPVMDLR